MKMKKIWNRGLGVLLAGLLLVTTGCAGLGGFDAKGYTKACLDFLYLGEMTEYTKMVEITPKEAEMDYLEGIEVETDMLLTSFECPDVYPATRTALVEFYKEVYKKSKYEIVSSERVDRENYTVELQISPIDIFKISEGALDQYLDEFAARAETGEFEEMDDAAFSSELIDGYIEILKTFQSQIGYLEPKTVTVTVAKDTDGTWGISDEGAQEIDEHIIAYDW